MMDKKIRALLMIGAGIALFTFLYGVSVFVFYGFSGAVISGAFIGYGVADLIR